MRMKKLLMIVVCALAVHDSVALDIDKHSEAYIRQRINIIYGHVKQMIVDEAEDNHAYMGNGFNLDSAYCSSRYYSLIEQALEITSETGDILFDYDHWVCGQDYSEDWYYTIQKVSDITDSTATAEVQVINFGNVHDLILSLLYERDDWYIDEFGASEALDTDQNYFRHVISDGLKAREKAKTLAGEWGWVGEESPELILDLKMTDHGLKAEQCDIYRMYGFDKTTVTYDGEHLSVTELEYDAEKMQTIRDLSLYVSLNGQGDLMGTLRIKHPQAGKEYDGPITLRKGYFKYRDRNIRR